MVSLGIDSNSEDAERQARAAFASFPGAISRAMTENSRIALKFTIVQIDLLIYSTPGADTYVRTKNLRRSNKRERLGSLSWLLYNDAEYAGFVHDGTSEMAGRPWMANAIELAEPVMEANLVTEGTRAIESG